VDTHTQNRLLELADELALKERYAIEDDPVVELDRIRDDHLTWEAGPDETLADYPERTAAQMRDDTLLAVHALLRLAARLDDRVAECQATPKRAA
jgi:hypothetical protein